MTPSCPACRRALPPALLRDGAPEECPFCAAHLEIIAFPASGRGLVAADAGETLLADSEASCFYHPHKRAATACDRCGRFLCRLCEVEVGGERYCPGCVALRGEAGLPQLDRERTRWDRLALALAIYPAITIWLPVVTAPMALIIAIKHWRTPLSLVASGRPRLVLACVLAVAQIVGIAALIVVLALAIARES